MAKADDVTRKSSQYFDALEHDDSLHVKKVMPYSWSGGVATPLQSELVATKDDVQSDYAYSAVAPVGSLEVDAVWQVSRTSLTSPYKTEWADGNASFDNVATDLTALTYS